MNATEEIIIRIPNETATSFKMNFLDFEKVTLHSETKNIKSMYGRKRNAAEKIHSKIVKTVFE